VSKLTTRVSSFQYKSIVNDHNCCLIKQHRLTCHSILIAMPCIKIIDGIKVYIYGRDHNPPHFHIIFAEYEELIVIKSLESYSGYMPSKHRRKIIQWAQENHEYILRQWNKLN
jgi:hypothetical protein